MWLLRVTTLLTINLPTQFLENNGVRALASKPVSWLEEDNTYFLQMENPQEKMKEKKSYLYMLFPSQIHHSDLSSFPTEMRQWK